MLPVLKTGIFLTKFLKLRRAASFNARAQTVLHGYRSFFVRIIPIFWISGFINTGNAISQKRFIEITLLKTGAEKIFQNRLVATWHRA